MTIIHIHIHCISPLLVVNLTFNNVNVPVENVLGPLGSSGEVSLNLALSPTKKNTIFHNKVPFSDSFWNATDMPLPFNSTFNFYK